MSNTLNQLVEKAGFDNVAMRISRKRNITFYQAKQELVKTLSAVNAAVEAQVPVMQKTPEKYHLAKAVIIGQSYDQPIPMPMLSNGMPDWESPDLDSFVSLVLKNVKGLEGRVVVLKRLANGMYTIAADSGESKHPEDRDKDKSKLKKEDQPEAVENVDATPVGEEVVLRSLRQYNQRQQDRLRKASTMDNSKPSEEELIEAIRQNNEDFGKFLREQSRYSDRKRDSKRIRPVKEDAAQEPERVDPRNRLEQSLRRYSDQ